MLDDLIIEGRMLGVRLEELAAQQLELAARRREIIKELKATYRMPYIDVARRLGFSNGRLYQILKGGVKADEADLQTPPEG